MTTRSKRRKTAKAALLAETKQEVQARQGVRMRAWVPTLPDYCSSAGDCTSNIHLRSAPVWGRVRAK